MIMYVDMCSLAVLQDSHFAGLVPHLGNIDTLVVDHLQRYKVLALLQEKVLDQHGVSVQVIYLQPLDIV